MDEKKAVEVLNQLVKKDILNTEEKEAVSAAIGLLSWSALAKSLGYRPLHYEFLTMRTIAYGSTTR